MPEQHKDIEMTQVKKQIRTLGDLLENRDLWRANNWYFCGKYPLVDMKKTTKRVLVCLVDDELKTHSLSFSGLTRVSNYTF